MRHVAAARHRSRCRHQTPDHQYALSTNGLTSPWGTPFGGKLYFVLNDGTHGWEPWVTDLTAAGTKLVADINAGAGSSFPTGYLVQGSHMYFAADDGVHGVEPWSTDSTTTTLVADVAPGGYGSNCTPLATIGSKVAFACDNGVTGQEPWIYTP